ncbi:immunoglobulin-like domain-containing protein, partial [Tissierellaceae bacterium HCP3S3_D8]
TEITVEFGGDFTNPEVKAGEEAVKPAITKDGEVVDNVDVTEAGIYTLTYSKEGYKTLVIRVTVKEKPEDENFTYTDETEITVEFGGDFTNPEVKAGEEAVKPAITKDGEVVDNVNVNKAGVYTLTYSKEGYKTLVITVTVKEETILEAPADGATEFTIKLEEEEGLDIKYLAFGLMNEANSAQKVATLEDVKSHLKKEYGVDFKSENIKLDQTNKTLSITGQLLSTEDWNKVKEEGKKDEPYRITVLNKDKSNKLVKIAIYEDGKAVFHNTKNELIKK